MVTPHCRCCIDLAEPPTNQWNYRKQFVATVCPASKLVTSAARLSAAHAVVKVAATCLAARYVFCLFSPPRQCPTSCSKQCCFSHLPPQRRCAGTRQHVHTYISPSQSTSPTLTSGSVANELVEPPLFAGRLLHKQYHRQWRSVQHNLGGSLYHQW